MGKAETFLKARPGANEWERTAYQGEGENRAAAFLEKSPLSQNRRTQEEKNRQINPTNKIESPKPAEPTKTETKINPFGRATQESARERYALRQEEKRTAEV